ARPDAGEKQQIANPLRVRKRAHRFRCTRTLECVAHHVRAVDCFNRGSNSSAVRRLMASRSSFDSPRVVSPSAVTVVGTKGLSLPNRMCEVGTKSINADMADRFAELAI